MGITEGNEILFQLSWLSATSHNTTLQLPRPTATPSNLKGNRGAEVLRLSKNFISESFPFWLEGASRLNGDGVVEARLNNLQHLLYRPANGSLSAIYQDGALHKLGVFYHG